MKITNIKSNKFQKEQINLHDGDVKLFKRGIYCIELLLELSIISIGSRQIEHIYSDVIKK